MQRGESALAYARHVRADSQYLCGIASAARLRSQALRATALQVKTRSARLSDSLPYAGVAGTRTGARVHLLIRQDGTVDGRRSQADDPLKATLAAARECEHVTSISFRRAGRRPGVPQIGLVAQLRGNERDDDVSLEEARREIAEDVDDKVVRLLFHAGVVATSLLHAEADPRLHARVAELVTTLDDAVLALRSLVLPPSPDGDGASPAA